MKWIIIRTIVLREDKLDKKENIAENKRITLRSGKQKFFVDDGLTYFL